MARTAQENPEEAGPEAAAILAEGPGSTVPEAESGALDAAQGWSAKRIALVAVVAARRRVAVHQVPRRPAALRGRHAQRHDARRAVLRRGQRVHADLRPDARRQHGARLAVPAGRLHRAGDAGRVVQGGDQRADPVAVRRDRRELLAARLDHPAAPRHRDHRRDRRADPAGVPALEPGPGPAPGADHDRALGDHRRPDAGGVRRHLEGHQDADRLARPASTCRATSASASSAA